MTSGRQTQRIRENPASSKLQLCDSHSEAQRPASFDGRLLYRHDGVHVTQAISQYFHDMRRKMRRLLNEKVKPAPVDLRQAAGLLRHGIGRARSVID